MARHKEFDPDEALKAARERFHRCGFGGSSMQDLLGDMTIGKGSFYATFGSKKALFGAALDHYGREAIGAMMQILREADEPLVGLRNLLDACALRYSSDPQQRGCMLVNTVTELAPHDPEIAAILSKHWGRLEKAIAKALTTAKRRGALPADSAPAALARCFVAVIHGLAVRSKYDPRPEVLRAMARTAFEQLC